MPPTQSVHAMWPQTQSPVAQQAYLGQQLALQGSYSQVQAGAVQGRLPGAHPAPQVVQQHIGKAARTLYQSGLPSPALACS